MGTRFERGVFENPDDPLCQDDVDTSIVVVVRGRDRQAARRAVERCLERWWGIDGAGRHHEENDDAFWEAQSDYYGVESHTAKYFSDVAVTPAGVEVYVDAQSLMPAPMRRAYRRVLAEELAAAGIADAVVRSQHADNYRPPRDHGPLWPPYQDNAVLCLPPGVPAGQVLRQELHCRGGVANPLLPPRFDPVWEATAIAATSQPGQTAVRETLNRFEAAGWHTIDPVTRLDPDGEPFLFSEVAMDRAVGFVGSQDIAHVHSHHMAVPPDATQIIAIAVYYNIPQHAVGR
jgi:hypothetical protein